MTTNSHISKYIKCSFLNIPQGCLHAIVHPPYEWKEIGRCYGWGMNGLPAFEI